VPGRWFDSSREDWLMPERFSVRVTKDYLVFCSGHFISYEGDKCERLHGHNYRAAVEVEGVLDENFYVFDFIALKERTKAIIDELDHRMMLPTKNRVILLEESPKSVSVRYKDREWVFPRDDCVLLPIENTTAELLARYLGERLREDLRKTYRFVPEVLRVEVEECFGQSAMWEWRGDFKN
jgi:6-pyruvoyltetrahydropterin/6-carboxytetrahydropterin synthase